MTPAASNERRLLLAILILAATSTFLLGAIIGAPAAYYLGLKVEANATRRDGWTLRPIVVYAADLKAGDFLTFDNCSQRSIPERYFDESMVTPDVATKVVNVRVRAGMKKGAPVRWGDQVPKSAEHCFNGGR